MTIVEQDTPQGPPCVRRSGRRALAGLVVCSAALLAGASSAWAGVALSVSPDPPGAVVVGQTGVPSTITVTNLSSGAQALQSVAVDEITLVGACGTQATTGADCPAAAADLGTLRLSAAGRGLSGTACDGTTFTIGLVDAAQGKYRFTPSAPVVLGAPGTPASACIIGFTLDAIKAPAADADAAIAGAQTDQVAYAHGVAAGGLRAAAVGANELTITGVDESPTAAYTPSISRPAVGQVTSFDATASSDPDGTITAYRWVWGDGTPDGSGPTPTHVFTAPGVRSVGLYVTDSDGRTAAVGHGITVVDELPTAAYGPSTYTPVTGQTVTFRATASDPDGTITAYRWVWGDGTPDGSGPTATHVFATIGLRSVGLYVTDSDGQTVAVGHGITVLPSG